MIRNMKLTDLTPESILNERIPLSELLPGSLFYPACGSDGRPIKYCNTIWRRLGIDSFVYCDFLYGENEIVRDMHGLLGYHVVAHRSLREEEWRPAEFSLELGPKDGPHYHDTFLGHGKAHPYAHWAVLERDPGRSALHGPKRISLLYVGDEGLATFQRLYLQHHAAPKMLCLIQCWGFAGNWTDFASPDGSLCMTVRNHPECRPEWLCTGASSVIYGLQHVAETDWTGARLTGYFSRKMLEERFGCSPICLENKGDVHAGCFRSGGRTYLTLGASVHVKDIVYDITDCEYGVIDIMRHLLIRENACPSEDDILREWTGIEYISGLIFPYTPEVVLAERLRRESKHPKPDVSKALTIVEALKRPYLKEGLDISNFVMDNASQMAEATLAKAVKDFPELGQAYRDSRLIRRAISRARSTEYCFGRNGRIR